MRRDAHRPYAAGLTAALVLLGACSTSGTGGPASTVPATGASSSPSVPTTARDVTTTSSPTTASAPPSVPAAAKVKTEAGAEAFTTYFMSVANRAYSTQDASLLQPLVGATCKTCASMISQLQDYRRKQQRYVGEFVHPTLVTIAAWPGDGSAKTLVTSTTSESTVEDSTGTTVKTYAAQSGSVSVFLSYTDSWVITEIKGVA